MSIYAQQTLTCTNTYISFMTREKKIYTISSLSMCEMNFKTGLVY